MEPTKLTLDEWREDFKRRMKEATVPQRAIAAAGGWDESTVSRFLSTAGPDDLLYSTMQKLEQALVVCITARKRRAPGE